MLNSSCGGTTLKSLQPLPSLDEIKNEICCVEENNVIIGIGWSFIYPSFFRSSLWKLHTKPTIVGLIISSIKTSCPLYSRVQSACEMNEVFLRLINTQTIAVWRSGSAMWMVTNISRVLNSEQFHLPILCYIFPNTMEVILSLPFPLHHEIFIGDPKNIYLPDQHKIIRRFSDVRLSVRPAVCLSDEFTIESTLINTDCWNLTQMFI